MTEIAEQRIRSLEQHLTSQPKSPLFAQLADYYLEAGRAQEALNLCDRGLAQYPFYTTGHLIKGKALLALNMRSEARRELEFVHEALPMNESIRQILSQIPQGEEEALAASAAAETATEVEAPSEATVQAAPPGPPPEPGAEQWMSQFTEAAAEAPSAEAPAEPQPAEAAAPEAAEPFAPLAESAADAFGLGPESAESVAAPAEAPAPQVEGEPFDQFAEQKRGELFGLENSLSLEEYLNEGAGSAPEGGPISTEEPPAPEMQVSSSEEIVEDPFAALTAAAEAQPETPAQEVSEDPFAAIQQPSESPAEPSPGTTEEDPFAQLSQPPAAETGSDQNQIEEIAEKLKDAKRITPIINFSEKETTPASESEAPSGTGFVTPTLAEIYAKQGWYDDAIKAYKALAHTKPLEKEKFEKRIQELEELKKQQNSVG